MIPKLKQDPPEPSCEACDRDPDWNLVVRHDSVSISTAALCDPHAEAVNDAKVNKDAKTRDAKGNDLPDGPTGPFLEKTPFEDRAKAAGLANKLCDPNHVRVTGTRIRPNRADDRETRGLERRFGPPPLESPRPKGPEL